MTDIARDLVSNLRKKVSTARTPTDPRELVVVAAVPEEIARGIGSELEDRLQTSFDDCVQRLGLHRRTSVEVRGENGRRHVEVSADGRPVALIDAPSATGGAASLGRKVHRALLRRLPVLLDDADAARLGPPFAHATSTRRVLEYLLDHGFSLAGLTELAEPPPKGITAPAELAEVVIDARQRLPVVVEVPDAVLRDTPDQQRGALVAVRTSLFEETGARFPDVQIERIPRSEPTAAGPVEVAVRFNDVQLAPIPLGEGAGWQDVAAALDREVRRHLSWFVDLDDVRQALWELRYVAPDIVDLSKKTSSKLALCACLRSLLADGFSVRTLPRIMWLQLEVVPPEPGPDLISLAEFRAPGGKQSTNGPGAEVLASLVRGRVAFEAWIGGEPIHVGGFCLPSDREAALLAATTTADLAAAEWWAVRAVHAHSPTAAIVAHSPHAIGPMRRALKALPDSPQVVASQELPPIFEIPPELPAEIPA